MSAEYTAEVSADCRRKAERFLRAADFVEARLERFGCICVHDDSIHIYDEADAVREFGVDGWRWLRSDMNYTEETMVKVVESHLLTYWRPIEPGHVFTPSLPLL